MAQVKYTKDQIQKLTDKITIKISGKRFEEAFQLIKPVLDQKVWFPDLDSIGLNLGQKNLDRKADLFTFLDKIVEYNAMGSYVIASKALIPFLEDSFEEVIEKTKEYIIKGDVWHVCDNTSERSLGQALVDYFDKTVPVLEKFLKSNDRWLQRAVGVAIHFFQKRRKNDLKRSIVLLQLTEPYFEKQQRDVAKGIGWGMKTIGKHHPELLTEYLIKQLRSGRVPSKIIIRKSLTYLPVSNKERILKYV